MTQQPRLKWLSKSLVLATLLISTLVVPAQAYNSPGSPSGFVNDFAQVIPDDLEASLEQKLVTFEQSSSNEISVVTIPSLEGGVIENVAVKLFEEWGIGKAKEDNGVLLLIAIDDRKMRIEVGYGLEGALTDAQSSWIIRQTLTPAFRESKYYDGIDQAVDQIISATQGEYIPAEAASDSDSGFGYIIFAFFIFQWLMAWFAASKSWWLGGIVGGIGGIVIGLLQGFLYAGIIGLVILIPIGLFLDFIASRSYGKSGGKNQFWRTGSGGWSSKGGGGGFGGFSGGNSGGGGSSGSW